MAFVITAREDNRILMIGKSMDYMSNGYPRLVEENVAFVTEQVYVNGEATDGKTIPAQIDVLVSAEPEKWCYTKEDGFYENPNWKEPMSESEDEDANN